MKSLWQNVTLHPMGLRTFPIDRQILHAMTFLPIYRWDFNSFGKLGNILHQSCAWLTNSNPTVHYVCMSFYNMLRYYCTDLTTKGLCLLERAKVFTIPPLLVQTIPLGYEVLPPPSIARHAGSRSVSVSTMVVLRCLVSFPCCGSGVVSPF